jgi:hypothetical protein
VASGWFSLAKKKDRKKERKNLLVVVALVAIVVVGRKLPHAAFVVVAVSLNLSLFLPFFFNDFVIGISSNNPWGRGRKRSQASPTWRRGTTRWQKP